MGRGGAIAGNIDRTGTFGRGSAIAANQQVSDDEEAVNSIRLQYPKSSRLLLGTTTSIQQPGFLKALETKYPLELSVECHSLNAPGRLLARLAGKSGERHRALRPFAVFFCKNPGRGSSWEMIGRTETVLYDAYHRFVTKLKVCCSTVDERRKELRVEVYDRRTNSDRIEDQTFLGAAQCSVDDIISEPVLRKELRLESSRVVDAGTLVVSADAIRPRVATARVRLSVDIGSTTKGQHKMFYVLSRQLQCGDYTALYRSEVLGKNEKRFRALARDVGAITAGVEDKLIRLEIFQYGARGNHVKLGFMQSSIDKLKQAKRNDSLLWWPSTSCEGDGGIEIGRVVVIGASVTEREMSFRLRVTQ